MEVLDWAMGDDLPTVSGSHITHFNGFTNGAWITPSAIPHFCRPGQPFKSASGRGSQQLSSCLGQLPLFPSQRLAKFWQPTSTVVTWPSALANLLRPADSGLYGKRFCTLALNCTAKGVFGFPTFGTLHPKIIDHMVHPLMAWTLLA